MYQLRYEYQLCVCRHSFLVLLRREPLQESAVSVLRGLGGTSPLLQTSAFTGLSDILVPCERGSASSFPLWRVCSRIRYSHLHLISILRVHTIEVLQVLCFSSNGASYIHPVRNYFIAYSVHSCQLKSNSTNIVSSFCCQRPHLGSTENNILNSYKYRKV